MPGRKYSTGSLYRYGFNGKEDDNDIKGEGNQQDYGERIYDTRLGKFLSVDPISSEYPMLTPYQFASNRPLDGIDRDGLEWKPVTGADGNITDYTWAGFNPDGSAPSGTVTSGSIVKEGAIFNYGSSSFNNYQNGSFSIDDGSNIKMSAIIFNNNATYNFSELNKDGGINNIFAAGELGIVGASQRNGADIAYNLNNKWKEYEFNTEFRPYSGALETDNLGLLDWVGPEEVKALFTVTVSTVFKKEMAHLVLAGVTRRAEFRAIKREMKIPMSEVPNVIKPGTKEGKALLPRELKKGESRRVYDFKGGKRIREDLPKKYKKGSKGNQRQHFNYGKKNEKLQGHSNEFDHKP